MDGPIDISSDLGSIGSFPITFSQDLEGEVYFHQWGSVYRIVPA